MSEEETAQQVKNIVTTEDAGPCRKKIIVEIPEQTIKTALDERYNELQKQAVVPGFRKGKAPLRLLEKRFGKEASEQVKLKLLADASESAVKDSSIDVLNEPDIDYENIELPESGSLRFDFEVEVRPEFQLPKIEGIKVDKPRLEITDEQLDEEIEHLQGQAGIWKPREEGPVEFEDRVVADVVINTGDAAEAERLDNAEIHVADKGLVGPVPVEKLDEFLVGAKVGQVKKINVQVPKTYYNEKYRGKKIDIEVVIKDIKYLEPAELNDDFFRRFGVEDENTLRQNLRRNIESRAGQQVKNMMEDQVYRYLLVNTDFDLPAELVADQSNRLLQRQNNILRMRGLSIEQIKEQMTQLQASSEQRAVEQLKLFFIMDKIAKNLNVEVDEEEINGYIARLALQQGRRPEKMREEMLRDGSLANFTLQVREAKCMDKLLEKAAVTGIEPKEKKAKVKKKGAAVSRRKISEIRKKPKTKKTTGKK
jgi:trigger factor